MVNPFERQADSFLTKLNICLSYDSATLLLGIYPTLLLGLKMFSDTKTCMGMFVSILVIIA